MGDNWSIGIYTGSSPLSLAPASGVTQPVLTGASATDLRGRFVADPFMLRDGERWTMLFELLEAETELGRIGWASSDDGLRWRYEGVALRERFHLSYPFCLRWQGQHYMIPETLGAACVRLYQADPFPTRWRHVADLVDGPAADPTLLRHGDRWWLLTCPRPYQHDVLRLHMAHDLRGPWIEHPQSPIVDGSPERARPAGRPLLVDGRLIRFAQDCRISYGAGVQAIEITRLDPERYAERMIGAVLGHGSLDPAQAWTRAGMHHIDAHPLGPGRWLACVDGNAG